MATAPFLLLACLVTSSIGALNSFHQDGNLGVEIDGGSAIIRRSVPSHLDEDIPAVALDAAAERYMSAAKSGSDSLVGKAQSHFESSGLAKTLQMLKEGKGIVEQKPLGTMVLLVNSADKAEMDDLERNLVPSILKSLKFRTPMTILFSGPSGPADDATIKLHLNPKITLSLVDVTQRVEQFSKEHATKNVAGKEGTNWKMDEFWAMHVHLLPELQNYHYAWRLSPKSTLLADVTQDLYQEMQKHKAIFGYRLLQNVRTEACKGLQRAVSAFYQANVAAAPKSLTAKAFLETFESAQCPQATPDFQLVDLDYLRANEVYGEYVAYLAEQNGFSKYGWGSHSAQTVFLATQLKPEQMLCMTPWVPVYLGESKTSCSASLGLINFGQKAFQDSFAQAQALQVNEASLPQVFAKVSAKHPQTIHDVRSDKWDSLANAAKGHAIMISLSVFIAIAMLGGGFAAKKRWGGRPEAPVLAAQAAEAS